MREAVRSSAAAVTRAVYRRAARRLLTAHPKPRRPKFQDRSQKKWKGAKILKVWGDFGGLLVIYLFVSEASLVATESPANMVPCGKRSARRLSPRSASHSAPGPRGANIHMKTHILPSTDHSWGNEEQWKGSLICMWTHARGAGQRVGRLPWAPSSVRLLALCWRWPPAPAAKKA